MWPQGLIFVLVGVFLLAYIGMTITMGITAPRTTAPHFDLSGDYSPVTCVPDVDTKEKVRTLMLEAIDQALKDHIVRMHEVWMRDDRGQPERATNGVRIGLKAYMRARPFILNWNPPVC